MNFRGKKYNASSRGMGVLQVIVILVLLGAAASVLARLANKQSQSAQSKQREALYQQMVDDILIQLKNPELCTRMLAGTIAPMTPGRVSTVSLNTSYGSAAGPLRAGWESKALGIEIPKIELEVLNEALTTSGSIRTVRYDWPELNPAVANEYRKFYGHIVFGPDWPLIGPVRSTWKSRNQDRFLEIAMIIDPATSRLYQCGGRISLLEACESAGGAYDLSTNSRPEHRCNPDLACFNHQQGVVTDTALCVYPYRPNPLGMIAGAASYLCTWCSRTRTTL
jgi:hypothetical protein